MLNLRNLKYTNTPLNNHYQLIERIGGGGFSDVWLAKDLLSGVVVVLKVFASSEELDEEGIKMFRNEFSIVCNLNHTNVLKPFTFDIFEGSPYIVLPYCDKGSASSMVGKTTEDQLWNFAEQVASGLDYIHAHNIVHQDIKPANVLINSDNQFMITDFGISTGLRNTFRKSKSSDSSSSGTMAYMSYECLKPQPENVIARDIWAFGASLYEMLTGNVPYGEYGGITQKSLKGKKPSFPDGTSFDLKNLICKCLEFNAWDRPSANEIMHIILDHQSGNGKRNSKLLNKNTKWISAIILLALVVSVVTYVNIFNDNKETVQILKNPNDSILLCKVQKANEIVTLEKSKNNIDSVNELNLCKAAELYQSAMKLNAEDSVVEKGRELWYSSQLLIDTTYSYLKSRSEEYNMIGAQNAANKFKIKYRSIEKFVSDKLK